MSVLVKSSSWITFALVCCFSFLAASPQICMAKTLAKVTLSAEGASTGLPDLFTGTMSYSIPIEVPAGRKGMDPGLALNYRSGNGNGVIGVGWELELGSIQRALNNGIVDFTQNNYLHTKTGYASSLISVGSNVYQTKIEGNFSRIQQLAANDGNPYWVVTDKAGLRFFFGQTAASRQDDPGNGSRIFKWNLDRVEDTNGNVMLIYYYKNQGQIYLDRIEYAANANAALGMTKVVNFYWETRQDFLSVSNAGFTVNTAYRLTTIDVGVITNPTTTSRIRTYKLTYVNSPVANSSLLCSVQQIDKYSGVASKNSGIDSSGQVTGGASLPAKTMQYEQTVGSPFVDYLTLFSNGIGGSTIINYTTASLSGTTDTVQNVSSVAVNDGNGKISTTYYHYTGGYYYDPEKDFRGFNKVEVWGPVSNDGKQVRTETYFHQGNDTDVDVNNPYASSGFTKGKPYRITTYAVSGVTTGNENVGAGQKISETTTSYSQKSVLSPPFYTPPRQVDSYLYDGDTGYKQSRSVYDYDAYGNVSYEEFQGDVSDTNDRTKRTTRRGYSYNTDKWLVGLPVTEGVYEGVNSWTQVAFSDFYYDELSSCTAESLTNLHQPPEKGNLTRVRRWLDVSSSVNPPYTHTEQRMGYDIFGNIICTRDPNSANTPNGKISTITYDRTYTFPVVSKNQLEQLTTIQYYGVDGILSDTGFLGQVKNITDPNGAVLNKEYDTFGRLTKIIDPYSASATYGTVFYQYPNFGSVGWQRVLTRTTEKADELTAPNCPSPGSYNSSTKMCQSNYIYSPPYIKCYPGYSYYPFGFCRALPYCPSGGIFNRNTDTCRSSNNIWSENYFDGLGRTYKTRKEGLDGKVIVSETEYDNRGAITRNSVPYFEGIDTPRHQSFVYDALGRRIQVINTDATGTVTSVTKACYNKDIAAMVDANGHRKRVTKDGMGQLVKVEEYQGVYSDCSTTPDAPYASTSYKYDVLGNLRFLTDAHNNQTEMRYNTLGHKVFINDPDMGIWNYLYAPNGNLTSQTDAKQQQITFGYDALSRQTAKYYPNGTAVTYTYDDPTSTNGTGRLTTMNDQTGLTKYNYDKLGRIQNVVKNIDGNSYSLEFTYDVMGRTTSIKYPDGEIVGYGYDNSGNLAQVIGYATYSGFNALGQPGAVTFGNGVTTNYQFYPENNRLKEIKTSKDGILLLNLGYNYYETGNLKDINNLLDSSRSQSFVYDELNRLTSAVSIVSGTLTYDYDHIGNIKSKEGKTYNYDGARPHAVTSLSNGKVYAYDNNGNIISDGQRSIVYNYDNMPTGIGNVGFSYDGNGTRVKKYSPGVTTHYVDKLFECVNGACSKYIFAGGTRIARNSNGQVLYYHPDHLGSTNIVTNAAGAITEDIAYSPFGATLLDSNTTLDSHKYTGQELDNETGLYNYNARLYDPDLGRFMSPDSIVPDPTNPQSLNRYAYVQNNPMNYTDPSGHFSWSNPLGSVNDFMFDKASDMLSNPGKTMNDLNHAVKGIMTAEIVLGTAASGQWWAFAGAVSGGAVGGYSASKAGGDIWDGVLFGAAVGGATGYLAGEAYGAINTYTKAFQNIYLSNVASGMAAGAISGAGSGATAGYAGGAGNSSSILTGMWQGAAYGAAIGGALGAGEAWLQQSGIKPLPKFDGAVTGAKAAAESTNFGAVAGNFAGKYALPFFQQFAKTSAFAPIMYGAVLPSAASVPIMEPSLFNNLNISQSATMHF